MHIIGFQICLMKLKLFFVDCILRFSVINSGHNEEAMYIGCCWDLSYVAAALDQDKIVGDTMEK